MSVLNFILISDCDIVEKNLRCQLDVVGENYSLDKVSYSQAPAVLNAKKYDRIFAALGKQHLREQANYLLALGKTTTPVTILEQEKEDKLTTQAIARVQRQAPNLEAVQQASLGENTGLLNAFFSYSIESQREQRMRSDARSKENVEQWQKISKLEIAVERLVNDQAKLENYFYGTTTPDGRDNSVLAAAAWVYKNQDELIKLKMEVRDLKKYVADCSADLQNYLTKIEQKKEASWQTKLAIGLALLGLIGSLGSALLPIAFESAIKEKPVIPHTSKR